MEQSRKNKLETERFEIRLWRRHLQHRLTDSTVTEDERLALQFRIIDLDEEERSISDTLMAHSFIQAEVDDEEIVNEERNREQQSINDRREAARLSGRQLGSVPYALAAQVAVPDYGQEGEDKARAQLGTNTDKTIPQVTGTLVDQVSAKSLANAPTPTATCKPTITKRKRCDSQDSDNGDETTKNLPPPPKRNATADLRDADVREGAMVDGQGRGEESSGAFGPSEGKTGEVCPNAIAETAVGDAKAPVSRTGNTSASRHVQVLCVGCQDNHPQADCLKLGCDDFLCSDHVFEFFDLASRTDWSWPPRCCKIPIEIQAASPLLGRRAVESVHPQGH